MRKKIAIFTYSLEGGGAERTVANLLNSLSREKYDIHLVLMNDNITYSIPQNIPLHFIAKSDPYEKNALKFLKLPMYAARLAKYCKQQKIDLVFAV
ncbi:MAG: hypothetical protein ABI091_27565, partial [Ferruginibacter sp.]